MHAEHNHGLCNNGDGPSRFGRAFAIGTGLNLALILAQVACGFLANSVALLADAGHNFSDVIGLLLAWGAIAASRRPPSSRYTYGFRSSSILAALANAIILLIAVGAIALEAIRRFFYTEPVSAGIVMAAAAAGILINGATAMLFLRGREHDLNIRGVFLHMAADAGISLGVLISGAIIYFTGWVWFDPLTSLLVSAVIVHGTWGLLRDSMNMALQAVPQNIDPDAVRTRLEQLPGVVCIHDLHIWPMSTTETALTCHLVMPAGHPGDAFIANVAGSLHREFGIHHTTLQIECDEASACELAPDHVV